MATNINAEVAGLVARAMVEKDISRLRLAEETGIPYTTLKRKLLGGTSFTFDELYHIATALGASPSQFIPSAFADSAAA